MNQSNRDTRVYRASLWRIHLAVFPLFLCLCGGVASAHKMRTIYLDIDEAHPGKGVLTRNSTTFDDSVLVKLPLLCKTVVLTKRAFPKMTISRFRCSEPLAGRILSVRGIGPVINEVVLRYSGPQKVKATFLFTASRSVYRFPGKGKQGSQGWSNFVSYLWLGIVHIFYGVDHLLFLLALLLLVRDSKKLVLTVSAFTVSHSITLGLTITGCLALSEVAAEACIAWSLVLSAWDCTRRDLLAEPDSHGIWLGFVFGLVHGLGFAGILSEVGVPENALAVSLVGFNVGVELAQLFFVVILSILLRTLRRFPWAYVFEAILAYGVGVMGVYWLWQRLALLL